MSRKKKVKIKMCPFCGGIPWVRKESIMSGFRFSIECDDCECKMGNETLYGTEQEAVRAWNRRS
jgi:Lar family restriction alleviation protein